MARDQVRMLTRWNKAYHAGWDHTPDAYSAAGIVQWGRSRRLGLFLMGRYKAYLGAQHVDPRKPGWGAFQAPETRFFASMFVDGSCVTLRTFQSMDEALDAVLNFVQRTDP